MRATARRIGRIVGQLEDLCTVISAYRQSDTLEAETPTDRAHLDRLLALQGAATGAYYAAEALAEYLNQRDRPAGEPLAKR